MEVPGESRAVCTDLASEFADFASECGAAISVMIGLGGTLLGKTLPEVDSPEEVISFDILTICSAISKIGDPSDEVARICCVVLARLSPSRFGMAGADDPGSINAVSDWLSHWEDGMVITPIAVECLSMHDKMYGGSRAVRAASVYSLLVIHLFTSYSASMLNDPASATAAGRVANEFLARLKPYMDGEGGNRNESDAQLGDNKGADNGQSCSDCSKGYQLLELPYGAPLDEVKKAQRELAKNLHPDSWGQKRGARFAQEQLKQINVACDHLATCRKAPSPDGGYGGNSDEEAGSIVGSAQAATEHPPRSERQHRQHATGGDEQLFWRTMKMFLRAIWSISKILLAISLAAIAAALVLLGTFMALWEYWEGEAGRERNQFHFGSFNNRLFSFLEGITWLPRQIWGGLMLVMTPFVLGLVFAGKSLVEITARHSVASTATGCVLGVGIVTWVIQKEWKAEFAPCPERRKPTTLSWVMGVVVLIASIAAWNWWAIARHKMLAEQDVASGTALLSQSDPPLKIAKATSSQTQGPAAVGKGQLSNQNSVVEAKVQGTLSGWANAIKANDSATELGYYGEALDRYFLRRSVSKDFVAQDKQQFYRAGKRFIDYRIDQVAINQASPESVTVSLVKHWQISSGAVIENGETRSRLWLTREQADWKITGEQDLR
jgi:hypothetical protein